ncbi:MAG: dnaN1, partial [Frankiales bacterium]|nr:dnaN1 [Frankiales bacterium]
DQLTLAATDRYRLAVRTLSWNPTDSGVSQVALVPAKTLADTAQALTGGPEDTLALSSGSSGEGMIGFEGAGRRTTTRLIDGEFPKYRALLPDTHAATAEVATAPFVEAVKRVQLVSVVAARNAPVVRLSFSADGVVLEAGGQDDAQASERLDCVWEGEPMSIAFNPGYLLDGLSAVDSETTTLSFTAPSRPAVLTGGKQSDEVAAYRYLLMPVRLSG